jgi:16S rRNA (adenine1518-N6/adenine1519-N6)-dimethyltransferase
MAHRPRKRFGQHFLHDAGTIRRIVGAIQPQSGQSLVEIGPGRGAITCPLLEQVDRLDVIELDRDLIPLLQARCAGPGELRIHRADALRFDFAALAGERGPLRVVGNLPYNVSTPLLFHLLRHAHCVQDMHFMLQREVVERMTAPPGSRAYGRLTLMLQYRCRAEKLFTVGAGAFTPPPQVESAFVRLVPHERPAVRVDEPALLEKIVAQAFSQRRKTLRNALASLLDAQQIVSLGLDPGLRPEVLSLEQYARLSQALSGR